MGRLSFFVLSIFICCSAFAKNYNLKGVIKVQIASPELTIDEKPHKYTALVLDNPIPMNVYSEGVEDYVLFKSVSTIQIGWKNDYKNYINKKVSVVAKECVGSMNAHIYTDVTCEVSKIKILK
ncbi:MAG: hypothetical protein WB445_14010 [Acinetobacter sp.]